MSSSPNCLYAYIQSNPSDESKTPPMQLPRKQETVNCVIGIKFPPGYVESQGTKTIDRQVEKLFESSESTLNKLIGGYIQDETKTTHAEYRAKLYKLSPLFDRGSSMIMTLSFVIDPKTQVVSLSVTRYILPEDRVEYAWSSPCCTIKSCLPKSVDEDMMDTSTEFTNQYDALCTKESV